MRRLLVVLLFPIFSAPAMRAQTPVDAYSVEIHSHDDFPSGIHFYCLQAYNLVTCKQHVFALRRELTNYPMGEIVPWSFVMVSSQAWEAMVRAAGGPPAAPAFTALHSRQTFFQDALFEPTPSQRAQFMQIFHADQDALFELAVSHELGHIICHETDEQKATACGRHLRIGKAPRGRVQREP